MCGKMPQVQIVTANSLESQRLADNINETSKSHNIVTQVFQFAKIAQASAAVDPAVREALLQDALQEVMDGYAFIFLFQPTESFAINPALSNITVYNDGIHELRYIQVLDLG